MAWEDLVAGGLGAATTAALSPNAPYTPGAGGLGSASQDWQNLLGSQMGLYGASPYAGGYQGAANLAGSQYGGAANLANAYSGIGNYQAGNAFGAQDYLQGAGRQVFGTAMDPQQALYNRTAQQLGEQVNAGQALRGLGTSAIGGQEYNQAMSNFNIDWQNQQLQRQLQGLQGLNSAYGQAGNYGQLGNQELQQSLGYATATPALTMAGGQVPYQVQQGITNAQLAQGQGIQNQILPYLGYGQGAQQAAYQTGSQNAGAAGSLLSQALRGGAQNYFGSSGGGFGGFGDALSSISPGAAGYLGDITGMSIGGTYGPATQAGLDALISSFSGGAPAAAAGGAAEAGAAGAAGGAGSSGAGSLGALGFAAPLGVFGLGLALASGGTTSPAEQMANYNTGGGVQGYLAANQPQMGFGSGLAAYNPWDAAGNIRPWDQYLADQSRGLTGSFNPGQVNQIRQFYDWALQNRPAITAGAASPDYSSGLYHAGD